MRKSYVHPILVEWAAVKRTFVGESGEDITLEGRRAGWNLLEDRVVKEIHASVDLT